MATLWSNVTIKTSVGRITSLSRIALLLDCIWNATCCKKSWVFSQASGKAVLTELEASYLKLFHCPDIWRQIFTCKVHVYGLKLYGIYVNSPFRSREKKRCPFFQTEIFLRISALRRFQNSVPTLFHLPKMFLAFQNLWKLPHLSDFYTFYRACFLCLPVSNMNECARVTQWNQGQFLTSGQCTV